MLRYILYFLVSFATMVVSPVSSISVASQERANSTVVSAPDPGILQISNKLSKAQLDSIVSKISLISPVKDLPAGTNANDIVLWLLNALGAFLTTVIMFFLHKWFPKIFPSAKINFYRNKS